MIDPHALPEGFVLGGRYRVTGRLGEGGAGIVYKAEQLNLGRNVALKVLSAALAAQPEHLRRFEREARVAATISHPAAVEIYDVGSTHGLSYMAMELLRGCELRSLMQEGEPLPLSYVVGVAATLADVLSAAHDIALVHRDLKPENIFVVGGDLASGAVKVVDFGLAFIAGGDELGRMTREGLVAGTPAYLSPEQASGLPLGPSSDVYSLGCVLYELTTGWPPFVGSWMNVLTQHLHVTPPAPRQRAIKAGIPGDLDALIVKMMTKDASTRPSVLEVAGALSRIRGTLSGSRHRGRSDALLEGRSQRMVSVTDDSSATSRPTQRVPGAEIAVGVLGPASEDLSIALAGNGIELVSLDIGEDTDAIVDVVLVRESPLSVLQQAVCLGPPVVAMVGAELLSLMPELLRLGISDVVVQPASIEAVVRKIRRAVARRRRLEASQP